MEKVQSDTNITNPYSGKSIDASVNATNNKFLLNEILDNYFPTIILKNQASNKKDIKESQ